MERIMINNIKNYINEKIKIEGWIYRIRKLKNITFIVVRDKSGLIQCVVENTKTNEKNIKIESVVSIIGGV